MGRYGPTGGHAPHIQSVVVVPPLPQVPTGQGVYETHVGVSGVVL
jgi:hypothetical protein